MELKKCPFCSKEGRLNSRIEHVGDGEYSRYIDYFYVDCLGCGARTRDFIKKTLSEMTEYTVQDFRGNPVLRAKAEDDYEFYIKQVEQEAIEAWNRRC